MQVDLSEKFIGAAKVGFDNWLATESLIQRYRNNIGADPDNVLDYFAASIYLRIFADWENFLESVCILALAGRSPASVANKYVPVTVAADMTSARQIVFGNQDYLLWHNVDNVIRRAGRCFSTSPLSEVLVSGRDDLEWFAAIRHSIAHNSVDAISKFERLARNRSARGFNKGPGRLLRSDYRRGESSWLSHIHNALVSYAIAIWPAT